MDRKFEQLPEPQEQPKEKGPFSRPTLKEVEQSVRRWDRWLQDRVYRRDRENRRRLAEGLKDGSLLTPLMVKKI